MSADTGAMGVGAMDTGAMDTGAMDTGVGAMGVGVGAMDTGAMDISVGAMGTATDVRSMCFAIYEDVGNEDLLTFIRNCNALRTSNPSSQELVDRIRMIPHILLQIALQLEYYKDYRHNDIRLENIVVDVRDLEQGQNGPVRTPGFIYRGNALELVRVTIIDFGKFNDPEIFNFSLAYISSPEALEQEFMGQEFRETFKDKQRSDLIGFCWVAIDLLTLSQTGYSIMEQTLIKRVLSKEQNYQIIALSLGSPEQIKRKALLFIYQLLMHNSPLKLAISKIFDDIEIDKNITFVNLYILTLTYKKDIILQILFENDKNKYKTFIMDLLSLLASIDSRPTIQNLKFTLKKFVETISS
jgi:serine/threonine protein kinase